MRKERMNNKGFSLVELIIVIAIMAILAAALAPQLMKYIEKSRVSTDATSCSSIESCVNAALADETAYKQVAAIIAGDPTSGAGISGATGTKDFEFWVSQGTDGKPIFAYMSGVTASEVKKFEDELKTSLSAIKAPKQTGMNSYKVTIQLRKEQKDNTGIDTTTSSTKETVTEVGDIKVQTVSKKLTT